MRKQLFTMAFLAVTGLAFSQNYLKPSNIQTQSLDKNGNISFVSFNEKSLINSSEAEAVLKEALKLDASNQLVAVKTKTDKKGGVHTFYKQYFKGVEVFGNSFVVHSHNGRITSINGTYNNINLTQQPANLPSDQQALQAGLSKLETGYVTKISQLPAEWRTKLSSNLPNQEVRGSLTILPKSLTGTSDRYVYSYALVNYLTGAFDKVYVDALDGTILRKEAIVKFLDTKEKTPSVLSKEQYDYFNQFVWNKQSTSTFLLNPEVEGTGETHYSGVQAIETKQTDEGYVLEDDTRFVRTKNFQNGEYLLLALELAFGGNIDDAEASMTVSFVDNDNNWTSEEHSANKDTGALDAHWAFSQSYDYFKQEFDRDGYDNDNSLVRSYVHITFFFSPSNAAWLDLGQFGEEGGVMLVGDGDYNWDTETGSYDIFSTLDVMSHEFAHGVNRAGGALIYEKEHGALDEGFADMWGAAIEAKMAPDKDKWTIGEELVINEPKGVRSFRNPKLFNQPNTYNGQYYIATEGCTPSSDNDNCGVHTNSGVPNYWFYLISDGGEGTNDNDYTYSVTGMGIDKAAKLIYAVQENYVQSLSTFADVMNFSITEAGVQYGENSAEVNTVKAAWCAVGVAAEDSEVCTNLAVNDITGSELSIYPNPVTDILNITTKKNTQNLTYTINNVAGQMIQKGSVTNNKINVNILPKGVYVLTLKGSDVNQTIKFIKK